MSNPSSSNWTTNVNRQKTKRWIEAKSYSYDGDDWGDADEYGEYDEPQVATKPTGLRKATAPASSGPSTQAPIVERERANSFDRDAERRAFSGPTRTAYAQPQPSQLQPLQQQQPIQEQSQYSQWAQNAIPPGNNDRGSLLNSTPPYDSRTGSMVSNANSSAPISGRRKPSMGQADQTPIVAPISTNVPPPAIGTPDKPATPTFIRPADIYRRIQEEREKERLSQESSRPSLSGLTRDESPAGKSDNSGRQASVLSNATPGNAAPITAPSIAAPTSLASKTIIEPTPLSADAYNSRSKGPSHSPKLPEIAGLSGFGDDFGGSFMSSTEPVHKTISASTARPSESQMRTADTLSPNTAQNVPAQEPNLHHQSSFGYKSVVNQAFDQAIPPTPSTTSGSGVDRSNSDSTNNISPIISREVSSAVRPEGMSNISAIAEEPAGSSRPGTSGSGTKRRSGGPRQSASVEPATIIPGHRRDTSLPSANNSPARTPAVEAHKEFIKSQEAEVSVTTSVSDNRSPVGRDRSSSPSKSRVRDLVDKLDSANNSRRGSQASLGDKVDLQPHRPTFEPKESFRPSLPGAWASYTTNPPPNQVLEPIKTERQPANISESPVKENSEDAFAMATAAGSALAGAFAAAASATANAVMGTQPEEVERPKRASKVDTAFHPEAVRLALPRNDSDTPSSIMPTPLEMKPESDQHSEYFGSVQPLQPAGKMPAATTLTVPQATPTRPTDDMSTKSSPTDLESDRLRKEIVRELSPQRDEIDKASTQEQPINTTENEVGYSSIYDSYLDDDDGPSRKASEVHQTGNTNQPMVDQTKGLVEPQQTSNQPMFSSTSGPLQDVPESSTVAEMTHTLSRAFSWETPMEIPPLDDPQLSKGLKSTKDIGEPELELNTTTPINQEDAPLQDSPSQDLNMNKELPPAVASAAQRSLSEQPDEVSQYQSTHHESNETIPAPQPMNKVPAFREIMAIQSTPQRIQVYDQTRQTFANMDTGLLQWIQTTINALPEHEDLLRNSGTFPAVVRLPTGSGLQSSQGVSSGPKPSLGPTSGKSVKGIFGGKTGSAAKGLFAKSKSKWRGGADKASKRFRGLSLNSNDNAPSKLYEQQENIWETDATAPSFANQTIRKAPSKSSIVAGETANSVSRKPNDLYSLDSTPSNPVSLPTTGHLDSPTLGRSNTITGGPISPLSGRTSFERKRASLAQKRASMEVPGSVRSHGRRQASSFDSYRHDSKSRELLEKRLASAELQPRLTVHQNQMTSFGEDFPSDLMIPAEYRIPQNLEKTPRIGGETSNEQTPTQADFPKDILETSAITSSPIAAEELKKSERKGGPASLWLDTTGTTHNHTFDGPASPDYALRPQEEVRDTEIDEKPLSERPGFDKHFSSLSFIQFDPVPSEDLALNAPITPKRSSMIRERSETGASSQPDTQDSESSFADYPAAEDFGALPPQSSVASFVNGHERSLSDDSYAPKESGAYSQGDRDVSEAPESTKSRTHRRSKQFDEISSDDLGRTSQDSSVVHSRPHIDSRNSYKRHSMLSDVRESREIYPYAKETKSQNRKSLLGLGLSMKGIDSTPVKSTRGPKFSLIPSSRKRTDTNLSNHEADPTKPSLTADGGAGKMQRAATTALVAERTNSNTGTGMYGEKAKKKRFSGLSSFINKAKPRVSSVSNSMRGRSPTPNGPVAGSKLDSTPEFQESNVSAQSKDNLSLAASQNQSNHQRTISKGTDAGSITESNISGTKNQLGVPAAHIRNYASIPDINSNHDAIITKLTAPPEEGEDYKTVYPPEFFGEQPPEGYYGPEEDPETQVRRATATTPAAVVPQAINEASNSGLAPRKPSTNGTIADISGNASKPVGIRPLTDKHRNTLASVDSVPPPTPPPKDLPKQYVTTTTTTTHKLRGPVRTTTESETEVSQQAHYESRLRSRAQESPGSDSIATAGNLPATPIVHTATTKTVTRFGNGESVAPTPRSQKRSSVPMVPPLNILKKRSVSKGENNSKTVASEAETAMGSEGLAQPRQVTPQLTLNTQTGPSRPLPVEQFSATPNTAVTSSVPSNAAPPAKTWIHPFIAKRSNPSQNESSSTATKDISSLINPTASIDNRKDRDSDDERKAETPTRAMLHEPGRIDPNVLRVDDPVLVVPPLTIRKSPELGHKRGPDSISRKSPNAGLGTSPDPSLREDATSALDKAAPVIPLPPIPNRMSLHSPVLKDSPTLPRPTPPSTTMITPTTTQAPSSLLTARAFTPPPLPTINPSTVTNREAVHEEAPISPLPIKPILPTGRAMTPVEKMKDEPRVNEAAKESDESEDEIVMSSTAYPGQEWRPDYGYGGWDGYE